MFAFSILESDMICPTCLCLGELVLDWMLTWDSTWKGICAFLWSYPAQVFTIFFLPNLYSFDFFFLSYCM